MTKFRKKEDIFFTLFWESTAAYIMGVHPLNVAYIK